MAALTASTFGLERGGAAPEIAEYAPATSSAAGLTFDFFAGPELDRLEVLELALEVADRAAEGLVHRCTWASRCCSTKEAGCRSSLQPADVDGDAGGTAATGRDGGDGHGDD